MRHRLSLIAAIALCVIWSASHVIAVGYTTHDNEISLGRGMLHFVYGRHRDGGCMDFADGPLGWSCERSRLGRDLLSRSALGLELPSCIPDEARRYLWVDIPLWMFGVLIGGCAWNQWMRRRREVRNANTECPNPHTRCTWKWVFIC